MTDIQKNIKDALLYGPNSENIKILLNNELERALIDGYSIHISKYNSNSYGGNISKLSITKNEKSSFESTTSQSCAAVFGKNVKDVLHKLENLLLGYDKNDLGSNSIIDEIMDNHRLIITRVDDTMVLSFVFDYDTYDIVYSGIGDNINNSIKALENNYIKKEKTYTDESSVNEEQQKNIK